jgi:hypothetical protein
MATVQHSETPKPAAPPPAAPTGLPPEATTGDVTIIPPDFKLAKVGSRDYVAGQPVDEEELDKTMAAARQRKEEGHAGSAPAANKAK